MIKDKKMKRVTLKVRGEQGWQVRAFEDESYVGMDLEFLLDELNKNQRIKNV